MTEEYRWYVQLPPETPSDRWVTLSERIQQAQADPPDVPRETVPLWHPKRWLRWLKSRLDENHSAKNG